MIGRASNATPPDIEVETDVGKYAGMDGPVKHDMGLKEMDFAIIMAEPAPELMRLVGLTTEIPIMFYGFCESTPGGDAMEVYISCRGRVIGQKLGKVENGKKTEPEFTLSCTAYREVVDGIVTKDIDFLANRRFINGVDVLAAKRRILRQA
jgi:hypothetical protein